MKAWKVTHKEFPGMVIIHKASSRNQAKYKSVYNAREAGYYATAYIDATAVRAPEFDDLPDPVRYFESLGWTDGNDSRGCLKNERN